MERGSDVHNPRLDDEMEHETESLTRGVPIEARMLAFRRPATGIAPRDADAVVGRTARASIPAGTVLHWDQLEGEAPRG